MSNLKRTIRAACHFKRRLRGVLEANAGMPWEEQKEAVVAHLLETLPDLTVPATKVIIEQKNSPRLLNIEIKIG